jgi:hypothetical protein
MEEIFKVRVVILPEDLPAKGVLRNLGLPIEVKMKNSCRDEISVRTTLSKLLAWCAGDSNHQMTSNGVTLRASRWIKIRITPSMQGLEISLDELVYRIQNCKNIRIGE